jgi:hypothetical protein
MATNFYELAQKVETKSDFIRFLVALKEDREDKVRKERESPSSPYGPGANGWENGSIEAFLDSAAAWADTTNAITKKLSVPEEPSWRSFAMILLAGKDYE